MSYQALYRAFRPAFFRDVVGQDPIVTTLVNQIATGHIAHAYLFCGSRGTGKTTMAKLFARAINCQSPQPGGEPCGVCAACQALSAENNFDVIEIDAASNNGVDEIRELRDKIKYPPSVGRFKVYIVDEVHMLSTGAFNALLKTLEEPPSHAVFILATTEPQKLPATILSRCQRYDFKRIRAQVIVGMLRRVLEAIGRAADEEALQDIARAAEGGMRDALSLMDMCLAYGGERLSRDLVREVLGSSDRGFLFAFARALIDSDAAEALTRIDQLVLDGRDPQVFAREVAEHMRALMLAGLMGARIEELLEVTPEDAARYVEQCALAPEGLPMRAMELFLRAESDMKWASQPRAILELSAARACHPEREAGNGALAERLDRLERRLERGEVAVEQPPVKKVEAKPEPAKAEKKAAPAAPPPGNELWTACVKLIEQNDKPVYPLVASAVFIGLDGDCLRLEMPKKWKMYYSILQTESKKALVEQRLSEVAARPMHIQLSVQGDAPTAAKAPARKNLELAFDVFGRENVTVLDDDK